MTTIKQQRPTGGCTNCGAPVRTRKANGWVCTDCDRKLDADTAICPICHEWNANPDRHARWHREP